MRVAELCSLCATYINATCIIYNGDNLSNIDVPPLTSLDEALANINASFASLSGSGIPTAVPAFIGQQYIDTAAGDLYIGLSTTIPNWGLVSELITTTTTTTATPTTTTTTTV